jgi:chromosome segregation ATPase
MADATTQPGDGDLGAKVEMAKKRLEEAAAAASTAEKQVAAEIQALERDLERERTKASEALDELRAAHAEELRREREAKDRAIAEAKGRLGEIEAEVTAAERRIGEAEKRAAEAEATIADEQARAREAAAAWLQGQVDAIRREADGR